MKSLLEFKIFVRNLIKEAIGTAHAEQRFSERFRTHSIMNVAIDTGRGFYKQTGDYKLDDSVIEELEKRMTILKQINFPLDKSYAIKVMDLSIDVNKINYYGNENKDFLLRTNLNKYPVIFLNYNVQSSKSIGNSIYVIIRNSKIITITLAKNYRKMDSLKLKVDYVIEDWNKILQMSFN